MKKNVFLGLTIAAILIVGANAAPPLASALPVDEIQSQIKGFLARLAELTKQRDASSWVNAGVSANANASAASMPARHRICAILNRNLSQGTRGDDVRGLQEFLSAEGYLSASATGYFGPMTANAVARWQASQGVSAVGAFGPMSRERIKIWCGEGSMLTASPRSGNAPLDVTFTARVQLANPNFVMDAGSYKIVFGDGQEVPLPCSGGSPWCYGPHTVAHTYASNGTYTAQLVHYGYFGPLGPDGTASRVVGSAQIRVGPQACTMEYNPVCGLKQIYCITTPCNPIQQTYGNRCTMQADGATYLHDGACRNDSGNRPPTISSFSGPTTLAVNGPGTWTIQASDPENGQLAYSITWGDEGIFPVPMASMAARESFVQTTTFTHTYNSAGTYTVVVRVQDDSGQLAQTTTSVRVGPETVYCTMEYAPVCGQPPEPACRHSIPACMMPDFPPQTYGNRCVMNAAGATFLYAGPCSGTY